MHRIDHLSRRGNRCAQLTTRWTGTRYATTLRLYTVTDVATDVSQPAKRGRTFKVSEHRAKQFRSATLHRIADQHLRVAEAGGYRHLLGK